MVFQQCIALLAEILVNQLIGRIVEAIGPLELGERHYVLPSELAIDNALKINELIITDIWE